MAIKKETKTQATKSSDSNFILEVYVDGNPIPWQNINSLTVREYIYEVMPRINLSFNDDGFFTEFNPVLEGQFVEVYARLSQNDSNIISQKFYVLSSNFTPLNVSKNNLYVVNIDGLFYNDTLSTGIRNKVYANMNFSDSLRKIATENGIQSDIRLQSKDTMNWYQLNKSYTNYIQESVYKSNAGNDDVPFSYIGRDGILVYTSLRTEQKQKSNITLSNNTSKAVGQIRNIDNDFHRYYSSFSYGDLSGAANIRAGGFGVKFSYYDGNKVIQKNYLANNFNATDLVKYRNKNVELSGDATDHQQYGTLNNVYPTYFDTLVRNQMLRTNLLSNTFIVNAQANDYKLFQRINIEIQSQHNVGSLVEAYSGDYFVGGIIHNLSTTGNYNQMLICMRDGINSTKAYDSFINPLEEA